MKAVPTDEKFPFCFDDMIGQFTYQVRYLLLNISTTTGLYSELYLQGKSDTTHLKQLVAGVEISSVLEGGCHSGGQHLMSGHRVS